MEEEIELNLDDGKKIKEVTTAISNKTCQSIIRELYKKEMTESELSEKLNLPLSTVHYNLMKLIKSGIISSERFRYSDKGREMKYYKTTKKRIIIQTIISKRVLTILAYLTAGAGGIFLLLKNKLDYTKAYQNIAVKSGSSQMMETASVGARSTQINHHTGLWIAIIILAVISLWGLVRIVVSKNKNKAE